jgi:DNA polymerase-3 subunit delta'
VSEREEGDRLAGAPHPRQQTKFFGHAAAEAEILAAWNRGRLPHALLLGGPEGIGKATLAYRIARFLLSAPKPGAKTLAIPADSPASRQVAALSHPDLVVLRRIASEEGKKPPSEIPVDEVRRATSFFGSTAAMGGWRVAIVDSVDELNANGTNALLKVLEEPPPQSLFLLISHTPGRLIATIRSRCQKLSLRPLAEPDLIKAVESLADEIPDLPRAQIKEAAAAAGGSVRRALALLLGEGLEVRGLTEEMLARLPAVDGEALHKLGDKLYGGDSLYVFAEAVEDWLALAATKEGAAPARLARFAKTWENVRRAAVETDIYNLDRKPLVFQVFAMLAEATR